MELFNERQAHISMQQSKEQMIRSAIKDRNDEVAMSKQLEKQRRNSEFWHRVMNVLTVAVIICVAFTLYRMA